MDNEPAAGGLREKAEGIAARKKLEYPEAMPPEKMRAALHELHVHQIELEMQNDELRRAQGEIESARERYFDLYDMAPVGYCTLSGKGIILEANLTAGSLLSTARGELIGRPFSRYIYKEDQDSYYLHKLKLFEKEEPQSFELKMKKNDGAFFWADINAFVLRDIEGKQVCRITLSDITEHKRAEERLLFQSNLLSSVHDAIIATDEDDAVSYWNSIAEDITGWAPDEVTGWHTKDLYDKVFDVSPVEEIIRSFQRDGYYQGEVTARKKNGEFFIADVHVQGITGTDERRRGIVASFRDVTERKQAEEALRNSEEKLRQSDKNKNIFLNTLSHELRNPLAAISAGLQLLEITPDGEQIKTVNKIISRQMNQLCQLVDDLLDITRITHNKVILKKERVDLNELALSRAEDLQEIFDKKGIRLIINIYRQPVYVDADPIRLRQIIGNLLNNAVKYTNKDGRVILEVSGNENEALISIKDNGIGIDPEALQNLFTPFFQTDQSLDRQGGGLGLGLSIAKGITELHGGLISAFSQGVGKGAEFTIRLLRAGDNENNKTSEKERAVKDPGVLKILLIEDNRDLADLMTLMFQSLSDNVSTVYNGLEGLNAALKSRPDIIFCDIGLPGLDGYQLAQKIREVEQLKNVYMVAMTGYASAQDVARALEAGFDRHISKPVDFLTLMEILDNINRRVS